ncbi:MAG: TIGR00269 family protein [Nanoarchaeota archaeon]
MNCYKCAGKAVISLQHGNICRKHFLSYFENKVFWTINKYQLIGRDEKICVAASGGKDSLTALHLTKKYLEEYKIPLNIFALAINEGIAGYRKKTLTDLKKFCEEEKIPLHIISFKKEFGKELDKAYPKINKSSGKRQCNLCGVWRRYLINKYARKLGAAKVITGHNLDDEAQAVLMNLFKANTALAGRLGPKTGLLDDDNDNDNLNDNLFIPRGKPLYFCTEKETRLYALLKGFQVRFAECPYSNEGYRHHIQEMLNDFEAKYRGTKQGIINSFLDILPFLKEREKKKEKLLSSTIKKCKLCKEPANSDFCNACKMKGELEDKNLKQLKALKSTGTRKNQPKREN